MYFFLKIYKTSLTRTSDSINTRLIIDSLNTAHMKNGVIAAISPFCLHGIMKEKTNSRLHHSDKNFVLLQIVSVDKKKKIEKKNHPQF